MKIYIYNAHVLHFSDTILWRKLRRDSQTENVVINVPYETKETTEWAIFEMILGT